MPSKIDFKDALESHRRTLAAILSLLLFANLFVVVRDIAAPGDGSAAVAGPGAREPGSLVGDDDDDARSEAPGSRPNRQQRPRVTPTVTQLVRQGVEGGTYVEGVGTIPHGIDGNEITVVYYWKGDQTKSSPFLAGTGQQGNVDEGEAFRKLVAYINKHADGGRYMGFDYNLHGWRLKPVVVEAGKGDDQLRAAERIAAEIKPFAAVSSHGSISAYVCPRIAAAKIFNLATYDLDWGLTERTNGYCRPMGMAWGSQVDLSLEYLSRQNETSMYTGGNIPEKRVYGLLYAEYPGLVKSAIKLEQMMKQAGLTVVRRSVSDDLTTAGRQQPGVIAAFRQAGVNTIVAPDSGSLITFTHAAQAAQYYPDYYVWPCSGEDSLGMTRLYNATQWARAAGLTCYDKELNADLVNDDQARRTEWYKAYKEIAPNDEPPAPTSLVYQNLLPLVVGLTHAGRDLTIERFNEGLTRFTPYRYSAVRGRTTDRGNILVSLNASDGSQVGDAAKVEWDPRTTTPGNPTPGTYRFPEPNRRYARGSRF